MPRVSVLVESLQTRCKKGFRVQRTDPDQEWSVATPREKPEKEEEAEEIGYL